ncbi:MAG: TAT-variant-translocated molybdopterin oxidoreductase [Bacteroidia bacterium]|nr:TAT-variant-translocated molybdopterin oxidoreductase [Bacteroidia bacterium]
MDNKNKYWKGLEQLNNSPEFVQTKRNEFSEGLPLDEVINEKDFELSSNRRDFLKFFGFSVSAVALAACNNAPIKNAIPYVVKPEEITPGIPNYYASSCGACSAGCSILVKTREGRPVKIEGNEDSPVFKGGVCASGHASLLNLYDIERLKNAFVGGKESSWDTLDKEVKAGLAAAKNIRIVSGTVNSPSIKKAIADFTTKYPSTKHVVYEPISISALIEANKQAFGKAAVPGYRFDKAKVIVGFNCDFLGTWISPVEYTKQYSSNRRLTKENPVMSRHIQYESLLTITGSSADIRMPVKPSEEGAILISLYNKIAALAGAPAISGAQNMEKAGNMIETTAKELWAAKGASLVVCGTNNLDNQLIVNAINTLLGNIGTTVDFDNYSNQKAGSDAEFATFVSEMNSGAVDAVIFYNSNPAYSYADSKAFESGLKKVQLSVSTSSTWDETSKMVKYAAPDSHYLESWGDMEPKAGYFGLIQPTISTVFKTRMALESFLKWSDNNTDAYTYIQNNWKSAILPLANGEWNKSLHDGYFMVAEKAAQTYSNSASLANVTNAAYQNYTANKDKVEVTLYSSVALRDGADANNPWLQELPDPISSVVWDNYVAISKNLADKLGIEDNDLVNIKTKKGSIDGLPALIQPGQPNNTASVALGYGRMVKGNTGKEMVGKNAFGLTALVNGQISYTLGDVTIEKAGGNRELARTQTHHYIEGRAIIKEASLSDYIKDPLAANHDHHGNLRDKDGKLITLWEERDAKGHKWGMVVDLNACTGCGSCVVSCSAENNVPVVGRQEVLVRREMHWMRIDRYYSFKNKEGQTSTKEKDIHKNVTDFENIKVAFQPVMCQQCGHAPCESVCPVLATVHSSEGLNQMTYNRCVGTRYCANNCPYKVRRFNWFRYNDNEKFDFHFNNDLGKMVINPDVTVRTRGVMEKCTFCVQRIQAGKLKAKTENREIKDGDIKTACQQSCPANAIVFGDMFDANSEVSKLLKNERGYHMLEELNVQPSVNYLTKIRNVEGTLLEGDGHATAKHEEHKAEETHTEHH